MKRVNRGLLSFRDRFIHQPIGWREWNEGRESFREHESDTPVRVIDYVITLMNDVIGHVIECVPDEQGYSGNLFECPTFLNTTSLFKEGTRYYFIPFDEVEFLVPYERHEIPLGIQVFGVIPHIQCSYRFNWGITYER